MIRTRISTRRPFLPAARNPQIQDVGSGGFLCLKLDMPERAFPPAWDWTPPRRDAAAEDALRSALRHRRVALMAAAEGRQRQMQRASAGFASKPVISKPTPKRTSRGFSASLPRKRPPEWCFWAVMAAHFGCLCGMRFRCG